jgi:hypothetical protein
MSTKTQSKGNEVTTLILSCPVIQQDGKPNGELFALNCSEFSKSIGGLISSKIDPFSFRFEGETVTIPSGKTKDGKERFFSVVKQVVNAIFAGKENSDKATDKNHVSILKNLPGFHFADLSRLSVLEGVNIRIKNLTSENRLTRNVTRNIEENRVLIQRTGTANKLNKIMKEQGLSAAIAELEAMKKAKTDGGIKLLELKK